MTGISAAVPMAGAGVAALLIGGLLTEPMRRFALRHGITDRPSARKAHTRPTPYLGGVAVALATLAAGTAVALARGVFDPLLGVLLGGAAIVCVLGLIDDLRQLGPKIRLFVETSTATLVVAAGGHPTVFGGAVDAVLAVLWIVFITNAFNLLDNMDGAASSLCVVIGGFVCLTALPGDPDGLGVVMAALTGACLGFLFHNRNPARIFLGDAGSLFLGFTLASAMMVRHDGAAGLSGPASLLLATLVPTLDTTLVMLSRYRESRPLLQGGTDHIAHRLRRMGLTVPQVVRTLSAFAVVGCLAAMLVTYGLLASGIALLAVSAVGIGAVWLLLKVPAVATASPRVAVPAGALADGAARTALRLRHSGGSGRRHRAVRPMGVPHSRGARKATALSPPAGTPVAPQ
ncbi:MraY family glycosyltransferase [Streptomyces sp. NBC_01233]|uniref:MraY family glycosyltransferase n=1 Tax=Streptomyces sp. NBC_01233 TaxID=2903787 RepID=UPI002E10B1D6|nr:undecaprenyl/decaprenyl-phosphate alpha-N-acetylglucosaminyl 1-phosphate transferase [Streptomyces sp. NBC_01233]